MELRSVIWSNEEWWMWVNTETGEPESPLFATKQDCEQYFKETVTFH